VSCAAQKITELATMHKRQTIFSAFLNMSLFVLGGLVARQKYKKIIKNNVCIDK